LSSKTKDARKMMEMGLLAAIMKLAIKPEQEILLTRILK